MPFSHASRLSRGILQWHPLPMVSTFSLATTKSGQKTNQTAPTTKVGLSREGFLWATTVEVETPACGASGLSSQKTKEGGRDRHTYIYIHRERDRETEKTEKRKTKKQEDDNKYEEEKNEE